MDLADIKICKTLIINIVYFADSLNSYAAITHQHQPPPIMHHQQVLGLILVLLQTLLELAVRLEHLPMV